MIAVHTVIFDASRKRVLLIQRKDIPVWVLPGGGVEPGETPEEAAERETLEETGLKVFVKRLVGTYLPQNALTKKSYLFLAEPFAGSLQTGNETGALAYFHLDFLPKKMPPPYREWILDAQSNFSLSITKKITSVSYWVALKNLIVHPIFVMKFLLINNKK